MTIRPPTYAELTEACERAYAVTGDGEYLKAIGGIEEARDARQQALWADGRETDAAGTQPPPDLRLASCVGTAWQRFGSDIQGKPAAAPERVPRRQVWPPLMLGGAGAVAFSFQAAPGWPWVPLVLIGAGAVLILLRG